jgi:hypothetical protein
VSGPLLRQVYSGYGEGNVITSVCDVKKGSVPAFDVDRLNRSGIFVVKVTNQVIGTYLRWQM